MPPVSTQPPETPPQFDSQSIFDLTIGANLIAGADAPPGSAYADRNAVVLEVQKERARYANGRTLPAAAAVLLTDAQSGRGHSKILSNNLVESSGELRPEKVEAHHIVARADKRARRSRDILFAHAIAVNDADNGVFLPMAKNASAGAATAHRSVHTNRYYIEVEGRMILVKALSDDAVRRTLRGIGTRLLAGSFPF